MANYRVGIVVLALLAACSGPRQSLGLSPDRVATVNGASMSGFALLGIDASFRFVSVDGKPTEHSNWNGYPEAVEVLPGHHVFGIEYSSYVSNTPGPSGTTTLELDAVAGRTYQVRFDDRMQPIITDATDAR